MTRAIKTTFAGPGRKYVIGRKKFHRVNGPCRAVGKTMSEQGCRSLGLTPCERCVK